MWPSVPLAFLLLATTCRGGKLYNVELQLFDILKLEQETIIDFGDVRIMGRERSLNGTVHITQDMDADNFQMSVDFQTDPLRNGEWRKIVFSVPLMNICEAMRLYIGSYGKSTLRLGENTNLPFDGQQCPLPKGTYYIREMLMNTDTWPEIMPIGNLKSNFRFFKQGKAIGGVSVQTEISQSLKLL
ncbi:hypothetical protein ACLKA7_014365 [Drosophila subpalustris]